MQLGGPEPRHHLYDTKFVKLIGPRCFDYCYILCSRSFNSFLQHRVLIMGQLQEKSELEPVVSVRPVYLRMLSGDDNSKRFRDDEDEIGSQTSSAISLEDGEHSRSKPRWYRRSGPRSWGSDLRWWCGMRSQDGQETESERRVRRRTCLGRVVGVLAVLTLFGVIAGV